jgi:Flp pilus assembly protein TadB
MASRLRDNATLSEIAWELEVRLGEIQNAISEAERRQMYANGRIRSDLAAIAVLVLVGIVAVLAMWAGVEWRWWFSGVLPFGAVMWAAYVAGRAQEVEEPKWPETTRPESDAP